MDQTETVQRRADDMKRLTETAAGTEMGRLLRRFWHPVALSSEVSPGAAVALQCFGEQLTLFRGDSGRVHLVGARCAHRRTLLHTGWIIGDEIRCTYHGWQYDGRGQCTLRPAEKDAGQPNVRIPAYPVHEYCGLVFAYLGEGAPPEFDLPRKPLFERKDVLTAPGKERWDCNWLQQVENSLDATHVSFVHHAFRVGPFGEAVTTAIPELSYDETEAGVEQTATRSADNIRKSDWTFPNNNHIVVPGLEAGDPWIHVSVWVTPRDDLHSTRFIIYATESTTAEADARFRDYFARYGEYHPEDHYDELFHRRQFPPDEDKLVGLTAAQDYVSIRGQGPVAERHEELLGRSDLGIVTLRRLFRRELDAQREGRPTKAWRRRRQDAELPTQPGRA